MKKIILKDNFAFLYLNKEFYNKKNISNTIKIYSKFFKTNLKETNKYTILKIEKINDKFSLEKLLNEFLNFLLSNSLKNKSDN